MPKIQKSKDIIYIKARAIKIYNILFTIYTIKLFKRLKIEMYIKICYILNISCQSHFGKCNTDWSRCASLGWFQSHCSNHSLVAFADCGLKLNCTYFSQICLGFNHFLFDKFEGDFKHALFLNFSNENELPLHS